jgi:AraC family transcriptional regulator, regulatory protein of adaptative response / methylated-DNA-[protein]-cysteine methyltransferase
MLSGIGWLGRGDRPTSVSMMNLAMNEHRLTKPGPQNAALRDYDSVRRAIAFISEHWRHAR